MVSGRRVLITAGAGGIGLAIAKAFVAEGAKVHICDIDREALRVVTEVEPSITRPSAMFPIARPSNAW
jgi:NAD(P)-dependent dehydrogenase (short-subunit alcohol dehydrogenase family)